MFQKRRQKNLKQTIRKARDPMLRELHAELSRRQEKVAQLELELSDTRANLARFEHELETRLGPLYRRLEELENRLNEARRKAAYKHQWGDKADKPDISKDAAEQFYKTWTSRESKKKPPPPPIQIGEKEKAELKNLFRSLAKMYHPDLVTDPEQKSWRARRMAQINEAYISDDLITLKKIADKPAEPEPSPVKTPSDATASLKAEIQRLDGVIVDLERTLTQLINSHTVQLMLDVSMARRVGQDLLAQMANDLQSKIFNMEAELESLSNN